MKYVCKNWVVVLLGAMLFVNSLHAQSAIKNALLPTTPPNLVPEPKHRAASQTIAKTLAQQHYKKTYINNEVSSQVFHEFIRVLDNSKIYFTKNDIDAFKKKYEFALDDSIMNGVVDEAYDIHFTFMKRWLQRYDYALGLLESNFDFAKDEFFEFNRENAQWMKNEKELNQFWRLRVKNDYLNLKLAGKEKKEIKELLSKRYGYAKRRILQTNSQDVFNYYMNALLQTVEPHTAYMSPRRAENFDIDMSLRLQGIGAVLQTDDVYTKVVSLVPKGPADKSKQMSADDKIIGVGQGDGDLVDIVGWRLDDVVDLIRGEKGSIVRLEIIPKTAGADANSKIVTIVRDEIKLEEEAAKSEIIEIKRGSKVHTLGLITLPKFYIDFEAYHKGDPNYRSTTKDMRKILHDFKKKGVSGVIVDLRNNGGGSLLEATQSTGLFIKDGPIVQDQNLYGQIQVHKDYDPGIAYEGPLMVVVNSLSASASEIFAGAIQDYGRGIVVGSQTFGKGTVQSVMNLNKWKPRDPADNLGQLKFTVSKFYRVSGDSTQHKGVVPDVLLPDYYDRSEIGESSAKNALPWDQIRPTPHYTFRDLVPIIKSVKQLHDKRVKTDKDFNYLLQEISEYRELSKREKITLNEKKRIAERESVDAKRLDRVNFRRASKKLEPLKSLDDVKEDDDEFDVLKDEFIEMMTDYVIIQRKRMVVSNEVSSKPLKGK